MDNLLCIDSEIAELYYREKVKARGIIRKNVQYDMQILTGLQTYIDMVLWHSLDRPTKRNKGIFRVYIFAYLLFHMLVS